MSALLKTVVIALMMVCFAMALVEASPFEMSSAAKAGPDCLPASCVSFGCCSGNCDYWCRACKIPHVC